MALGINTNPTALGTAQTINSTFNRLRRVHEQLASGLRINRARDDAAGLAIAEGFRSSVLQRNQEVENLQSGVSAIQTAEGALSAQSEGIGRLRELAVQASNGILNDSQRAAINAEAQQIIEHIDATSNQATFNGVDLLGADAGTVPLGTEAGTEVTFEESTADSLGVGGVDLSTAEGAAAAIETLDAASTQIVQNRANLGAQQNRLEFGVSEREIEAENAAAAESRIRDLDVAKAAIERTRNEVLGQAGIAALMQSNMVPQTAARLLGG